MNNTFHHVSKIAAVAIVTVSAAISRWRTNNYFDSYTKAASDPSTIDFSISNTAFPGSISTGESVVFMYYYQNESGIPADGITITTTIPDGLSFNSTNNLNYTTNGNQITRSNLTDGYGLVLLELTADNDAAGLITNTVHINSSVDDPYETNNTYIAAVNIEGTNGGGSSSSADLSIDKQTPSTTVDIGQEIDYTLTVANTNGPDDAENVVVVDTLPDGLVFVNSVPSPDYHSGNELAWNIDTLSVGTQQQIQLTTSVSTLISGGDTLMNFATASTTSEDSILTNNVDFVINQVSDEEQADLGIVSMEFADNQIAVNGTTSLNMEVENAGPNTAHHAVLQVTIPNGVSTQTISPTPTTTTSGTITRNLGNIGTVYFPISINFKGMSAGNKTFVANIVSDTSDFEPGDNADTASMTVGTNGGSDNGGGSNGGGGGGNNGGNGSTSTYTPPLLHNSPPTTTQTTGHDSTGGLTPADQDLLAMFQDTFDRIAQSFAARACVDDGNVIYKYAFEHELTSTNNSSAFRLCEPINRIELAKIISQYAINIAALIPDETRVCAYTDMAKASIEERHFARIGCELGLIGLEYDGKPATIFDPYAHVSRAMMSTIVSRLLFGNTYNGNASCWYCDHMNALKKSGVLQMIGNPMDDMLRGYAVLMLMRADISGIVKSSIDIRLHPH